MWEILQRHLPHNAHAASYVWKHGDRLLDMNKTLEQNGVRPKTGRETERGRGKGREREREGQWEREGNRGESKFMERSVETIPSTCGPEIRLSYLIPVSLHSVISTELCGSA